ncbi:hypothetical protein K493DRAFT_302795 [Basidiobolus meristosporus CBS 931.73]|uniref:CID domain-containing protein n=1 Tax=Basidiobolus meristosporus CBS 931.73 TaxID=1314790 RepID=A0A1Y1Y5L6_9FUNG|nr:hypothetical protein K493DRAFT_302795 [Basidiobolus meristosporus CBS 931.73]|eukprot:ORX93249.1 hypothetical protein K493DRAFT_302795 [Basidiobolus meristosporus CBS 931.73]
MTSNITHCMLCIADPDELLVIDKLAEQTVKNPALAQMVMQRQFGNPKYSFMRPDGQYFHYFQWKIQLLKQRFGEPQHNASNFTMTPHSYVGNPQVPPSPRVESSASFDNLSRLLGASKAERISELLGAIIKDCSQIHIQHGRSWIFDNCVSAPHIDCLAQYLLHSSLTRDNFEPRLHILYLVNDMLFHSIRRRMAWIKDALYPHLVSILRAAYYIPNATDAQKEKVMKVLAIWEDKSYFELSVIHTLRSGLTIPIPHGPLPVSSGFTPAQVQPFPLGTRPSLPKPHNAAPSAGSYRRPHIPEAATQPVSSSAQLRSNIAPKKYYELPSSSMIPQVQLTNGAYIPIKVALLKSFTMPTHIPSDTYTAVDEFYKELSEMTEGDTSVIQSHRGTFDSEGWKLGLLDDYYRNAEEMLHKKKSPSLHDPHRSRTEASYSRGRNKYRSRSRSSCGSSSSRSRSRSRGSYRSGKQNRSSSSVSDQEDRHYYQHPGRSRISHYSRSRSRSRGRGRSRSRSPYRNRHRNGKRGYTRSASRSKSRSRSRSRSRVDAPISEHNVGYQLLQKLGWDEQSGSKPSSRNLHEPHPIGDVKYSGLGHGERNRRSGDAFESYRRTRSYTYSRMDVPSSQEPVGCFRCGNAGHIARDCRSHIP